MMGRKTGKALWLICPPPPLLGIRQYYQMQLLLPGWLADREITDGFLQ